MHRWEDNIRMDIREIGWEAVDWIHLTQDRDKWRALVNTIMNVGVEKSFLTRWESISFSKRNLTLLHTVS
jgi:hypothetical protein